MANYEFREVKFEEWGSENEIKKVHVDIRSSCEPYEWFFFEFCDDGTFKLGTEGKTLTFQELRRILADSDPTCGECGRRL